MVKLKSIKQTRFDDSGNKYVDATLYADEKSEMTNVKTGEDVIGLEDNAKLDVGSMVITSQFEVAQLNSSFEWVWG